MNESLRKKKFGRYKWASVAEMGTGSDRRSWLLIEYSAVGHEVNPIAW